MNLFKREKKRDFVGKYPPCDHLNNALAYLIKEPNPNKPAITEICFAISKSGGYFHRHVEEDLKRLDIPCGWWR